MPGQPHGTLYPLHRSHHYDHGDDRGLVLPPKLAPTQVVIVPIYKNDEEKARVMPVVAQWTQTSSIPGQSWCPRSTPGYKFNHWELRGIPLRIEVGPKDVENNTVAFARRDIPGREGKSFVPHSQLDGQVAEILQTIQASMHDRALNSRPLEYIRSSIPFRVVRCRPKGMGIFLVVWKPWLRVQSQRKHQGHHPLYSLWPAQRWRQLYRLRIPSQRESYLRASLLIYLRMFIYQLPVALVRLESRRHCCHRTIHQPQFSARYGWLSCPWSCRNQTQPWNWVTAYGSNLLWNIASWLLNPGELPVEHQTEVINRVQLWTKAGIGDRLVDALLDLGPHLPAIPISLRRFWFGGVLALWDRFTA